jgi:hypothetical protein
MKRGKARAVYYLPPYYTLIALALSTFAKVSTGITDISPSESGVIPARALSLVLTLSLSLS